MSALRRRLIAGAAAGLGVGLLLANAVAQEGGRPPPGAPPPERRAPEGSAPEGSEVDPQAAAVVRRMSEHLGSLRAFRVTTDSATEVVLDSGEKIQVLATSNVALQRPNKLRSERRGELANVTFIYDGDRITLYGRNNNLYAQMDAPNDLDAALDFARERLEIEAPGADLLYANAYEGLMQGVESGRHLGPAEIDGVVCDHVAFRGDDGVDWQLWVERGERPLPRRYVIVSNDQQASPVFIVEMRDWQVGPTAVAASDFVFRPPPGAVEIDFLAESPRALARRELQRGQEGAGS
jgi:hypothetical protein